MASPTPIKPAISARPVSAKAAELATVRRYFQIVNNLRTDMNAGGLAKLMTRDCPCQAQVRAIRSAAALGRVYIGRAHINVMRPNIDGRDVGDILVDYNATMGGELAAGDKRLTTTRSQRHIKWDFAVRRVGHRWLITRIDRV